MKTRIFIFIIMLAMLVGCIDHSISKNDFMIRVDTGYKERTGKDYIQCWVNDSLVFNGLYVNKTDDQILDYHEDWLGMEITRFDKSGYDSLKIKIRVTSLDTVLYRGKRVIDSTFRYRIDNIPSHAEQIVVLHCGILYAPLIIFGLNINIIRISDSIN